MKKIKLMILIFLGMLSVEVAWAQEISSLNDQSILSGDFVKPSLDQNGWSVIKPGAGAKLIYVSSTLGDDITGQVYDGIEIEDPRKPLIPVKAFKTIEKAVSLLRPNAGDWVLLNRGDVWNISKPFSLPSGGSKDALTVLSSYGDSTLRPTVKTGVSGGIRMVNGRRFIALQGISLYADRRDPSSASFAGWANVAGGSGFAVVTNDVDDVDTILLEDNVFNFFDLGASFSGNKSFKNIVIRRNQFLNSYSTLGHSQGLYAGRASLLLEENFFDHNGWYKQRFGVLNDKAEGQATVFNHNAYLMNSKNTLIVGNVFSNSSSIGLKLTSNSPVAGQNQISASNIKIADNLFVTGEVGISIGGNDDFGNGSRWENIVINDNIMVNIGLNQPTLRTIAWHIEANDWRRGEIKNNFLLCNRNEQVTNVYGINITGLTENVDITGNVIYGIKGNAKNMIFQSSNESKIGVSIRNNFINNMADCNSIKLDDASISQVIARMKNQSMYNWDSSLTVYSINTGLRSSLGF